MSISKKEYTSMRDNSVLSIVSLITSLIGLSSEKNLIEGGVFFGVFLGFYLWWLFQSYSIFSKETGDNTTTPWKVVLNNFNPIKCFYNTYYNSLELLNWAGGKAYLAYINWAVQAVTFGYSSWVLFTTRQFWYLWIPESIFVLFLCYFFHIVNSTVRKAVLVPVR